MEDELIRYDGIGLGELIFSCFIGHIVAYWGKELGKKSKKMSWNP